MITGFRHGGHVKLCESLLEHLLIGASESGMLLLVQVKMEGWDRSDTIGLSAVSDLVSLDSTENDLLVFVGSAGTLKFRFELDARTTV